MIVTFRSRTDIVMLTTTGVSINIDFFHASRTAVEELIKKS